MNTEPTAGYWCVLYVESAASYTGHEKESFTAWSWRVDGEMLIFYLPDERQRVVNFRKVLFFDVAKRVTE